MHKNVVGRQIGRIRSNRGWTQAELARELQIAGWDISRSEVSKIEMRIREVKDWQMMLLAHVLDKPHESFYPALNPREKFRDAFAATMAKKESRRTRPTGERPNVATRNRYHSSRSCLGGGSGAGKPWSK